MADVLHASLTGADLHESKGASSASLGQVAVATGAGTAVFTSLNYNYLSNKPTIPAYYFNGSPGTTPRIAVYTTNAVGGLWSISISGFTSIHSVTPVVNSSSDAIGSTAVATLNTFSLSAASGAVVLLGTSGNSLGSTQGVRIIVHGV